MMQVMLQDANCQCFQLGQLFIPREYNPFRFHSILHSQKVQVGGEPHPQNAIKLAYLYYEVCGCFQFSTSVWSSQPTHKTTRSIKKSLSLSTHELEGMNCS